MERNLEHLVREIEKISYGKKRNKAKRNLRMGSDVPSKRKEKSVRAVVTGPGNRHPGHRQACEQKSSGFRSFSSLKKLGQGFTMGNG
jgi:hypothetical protein